MMGLVEAVRRIFTTTPVFDPAKDPELQHTIKRQDKVVEKLRERGADGSLFEYLIDQSWESPEEWEARTRGDEPEH